MVSEPLQTPSDACFGCQGAARVRLSGVPLAAALSVESVLGGFAVGLSSAEQTLA